MPCLLTSSLLIVVLGIWIFNLLAVFVLKKIGLFFMSNLTSCNSMAVS